MKKTVVYAAVLVVISLMAGMIIGLILARIPRDMRWPGVDRKYHARGHQESMTGDRRVEIFQNISRKLKLSESQNVEIKEILKTSREQVKEVGNVTREKLLKIKEETNNKIRAVLSAEQKEAFDKMILEFKGRMKEISEQRLRHGPERGEPGPGLRGENRGFPED